MPERRGSTVIPVGTTPAATASKVLRPSGRPRETNLSGLIRLTIRPRVYKTLIHSPTQNKKAQ